MIRKVGYGRILALEDNLKFLRRLPDNFVDLVYIDPPFFTQRERISNKHPHLRFSDKFESFSDYCVYVCGLLYKCIKSLKDTGTLWIHLDDISMPFICNYLDQRLNRISLIVYKRASRPFYAKRQFGRLVDYIGVFSKHKSKSICFNMLYQTLPKSLIEAYYKYEDSTGRYRYVDMALSKGNGNRYKINNHEREWCHSKSKMRDLFKSNRIVFSKRTGYPYKKLYLDENRGIPLSNLWDDLFSSREGRTGYPTEKPIALMERIISVGSNVGGTVLDPCCGSGTTLAAAERLGRKWIGCDSNPEAIKTTIRRLRALKDDS